MGWVSQATEKVSEAATQALQPIEKGISQGVTDIGKTIANSPALEGAITAIAAYYQVPPSLTASFLAANKTSQTGGNLEKGLETLILSYGAGKLLTTGIDLNAAEAAATGGAGDAEIIDAALSGTGDAAITANQPNLAGQFGFGGASPAASAATQTAATTQPSLAGQYGFGNVAAPVAAETGGLLTSAGAPSVLAPGSYGLAGGAASSATPLLGAAGGAGAAFTAAELAAAQAAGTGAGAGALGGAGLLGASSVLAPGSYSLAGAAGEAATGAGALGGLLSAYGPSLVTGGLNLLGASNTAEKAREAAQTQAAAQVEAARIAAEAAKFRPVGVTTRFGTSQFTTDAQGNVIGAGYTASPEIQAYQNRLSALAAQGLTGAEGAQAAYAPLTAGAQSLFNLGQGYIQQTPEQQAADYIAKQQALLAPGQERQLAQLQNTLLAQGRGGLSVAQGGNLMATNPELAAYYNALAQSNLQLAAQGQQAGQQQAQFGAGLLGLGSDLMGKYYGGQTAAYAPFATAIDTSSGLENLAQQPMTLGTQIGAKTTASAAEAGRLLGQGMINSAATQAPANAFSYSGNLFSQAAANPQLQAAILKAFST
jgi:hypothetical protein